MFEKYIQIVYNVCERYSKKDEHGKKVAEKEKHKKKMTEREEHDREPTT